MALTEIQIERVREIIGFTSYDSAATLCQSLNAIQEAETVADITEWNNIRNKFNKIQGGKFGFYSDKQPKRLAIINRVRRRLGLTAVTDESLLDQGAAGAVCYSHPAEDEIDCGLNRIPVVCD